MLIDSHCHIFPPDFITRQSELRAIDSTFSNLFPQNGYSFALVEELLESMAQNGIDKSIIMGMGWVNIDIARECNRYIAEIVSQYSGKLIGYCSVNPIWGNEAISEVQECYSLGLRGIGALHPDTQDFDITGLDIIEPLMAEARKLAMPIVVHCSEPVGHLYPGKGFTTPDKIFRFITNFSDNIIICAHLGGGLPLYGFMPEVLKSLKNVYFDTSATPYLYKSDIFPVIRDIIGVQKILFGSDYPLLEPSKVISHIASSEIGTQDLNKILGTNISDILGIA